MKSDQYRPGYNCRIDFLLALMREHLYIEPGVLKRWGCLKHKAEHFIYIYRKTKP